MRWACALASAKPTSLAQRAEIGDVVVQPFQLHQQGPQPVHLIGQRDAECVLDGEAVGQRVAGGGVAADPFGQRHRAGRGAALEELLQAAVHEPQPRLELAGSSRRRRRTGSGPVR